MPASFLVAGRFDITSDLAGVLWQPSRMASSPIRLRTGTPRSYK
jgi:hypothetical protein